jgi:hypothetical protein
MFSKPTCQNRRMLSRTPETQSHPLYKTGRIRISEVFCVHCRIIQAFCVHQHFAHLQSSVGGSLYCLFDTLSSIMHEGLSALYSSTRSTSMYVWSVPFLQ